MEQRLRFLKGQTYVLGIEVNPVRNLAGGSGRNGISNGVNKDIKISVGKLGNITFSKGFYLYIGSAKNGLNARLRRHLSRNKKLFWHIDYLLSSDSVRIEDIWAGDRKECQTAREFLKQGYNFINRFGSSDCRCISHLFFIGNVITGARNLLARIGFKNAQSI